MQDNNSKRTIAPRWHFFRIAMTCLLAHDYVMYAHTGQISCAHALLCSDGARLELRVSWSETSQIMSTSKFVRSALYDIVSHWSATCRAAWCNMTYSDVIWHLTKLKQWPQVEIFVNSVLIISCSIKLNKYNRNVVVDWSFVKLEENLLQNAKIKVLFFEP